VVDVVRAGSSLGHCGRVDSSAKLFIRVEGEDNDVVCGQGSLFGEDFAAADIFEARESECDGIH